MNHRNRRHRTKSRFQKKFKNFSAALAGATLLTGALLPSMAATVQAASNPNMGPEPVKATEQANSGHVEHSKAPENYKKVLNVRATAYAPGPHDNDQWGNKTRLGTQIRPGVIAVDPNLIALGSRVYIQYPDGHGEYAVAEDTGGAIKGNRIDVAITSVARANDFGSKNVKVYVLTDPQNA